MNDLTHVMLFDGELLDPAAARVAADDRTLLYGLGAFETVRLHGGRPFLLDRHLQRLATSLASVGLPVPQGVKTLAADLQRLAAAAGMPRALCRITVTAGPEPDEPGPGVAGGADPKAMHVFARLRGVPPTPTPPRVVGVAPLIRDARSPVVGVKSTSYLVHYLLRNQAVAQGRVEDLLMDGEGNVTEGTVSSLFGVRAGTLVTPPLSGGVLAGVTRGLVLELAREAGIPWVEEPLPRARLGELDEAFLTGAGRGLMQVDEVDGHVLPASRPVGRSLAAALRARVARHCDVDEATVGF